MPEVSSKPVLREGDRRFVSVLFADVQGFTAMSEHLEPDLLQILLDQLMLSFSHEVQNYGGYVDKYEGDRIMAHFGSRSFLEQNSRRAVYAGLGMIGVIESFNRIRHSIAELQGMPSDLAIRVGINSGLVATGRIGMKREGDFTVYGDAVNLASRMEENGIPMRVLLPESVKHELEDYFEFSFHGELSVKGKTETIRTWLVKKPLPEAEPRRISATPFLGRAHELAVLADLWDAGSTFQILRLEAEAGMGKTRLLREFFCSLNSQQQAEQEQAPGFYLLETSALSQAPYSYFSYLLNAWCGINDIDNAGTAFARLSRKLDNPDDEDERSEMQSCLCFLLGKGEPEECVWDCLEHQKAAINRSLKRLIIQICRSGGKTVLAFDDLHFADEASLASLAYLLRELQQEPGLPLLLILVSRASHFPVHLISKEMPVNLMQLQQLSGLEIQELIRSYFAELELPFSVVRELESKSAGNPLYLEFWLQGIREMYLQNGVLDFQDQAIPPNMASTLLWRLNSLDRNAIELMQRAAVCGDSFSLEMLAELELRCGKSSDPGTTLSRAEQFGMLCIDGSICRFRHSLIWEAIYSTILEANRAILHSEAAAVTEQLYADNLTPYLMQLADHYLISGQKDKATCYLLKAESQARDLYMGKRILDCCRKLLKILPDQQKDEVRLRLATQLLDMGMVKKAEQELDRIAPDTVFTKRDYIHTRLRVIQATHGPEEAKTWLLQQSELNQDPALKISLIDLKRIADDDQDLQAEADTLMPLLKSSQQRFRLLNTIGLWHKGQGRYQAAQELFAQAIQQAGDDKKLMRIVLHNYANVLSRTGNRSQALPIYLQAIKLSQEIDDEGGLAKLQGDLGGLYLRSGEARVAIRYLKASAEAANMAGDKLVQANAFYNLAIAEYDQNHFAEAKAWLQKAMILYKQLKNKTGIIHTRDLLGDILYSEGAKERAAKVYAVNLRAQKRRGDQEGIAHSLGNIANLAADDGNHRKAIRLYTQQQTILHECKDTEGEGKAFYNLAILADETGDKEQALVYLKNAKTLFEKADLQIYLPDLNAFMEELTATTRLIKEEK